MTLNLLPITRFSYLGHQLELPMLKTIQQPQKRLNLSALLITLITISPAVLLVSQHLSWDALVFLAIYSGLSIWVVQILSADHQPR